MKECIEQLPVVGTVARRVARLFGAPKRASTGAAGAPQQPFPGSAAFKADVLNGFVARNAADFFVYRKSCRAGFTR